MGRQAPSGSPVLLVLMDLTARRAEVVRLRTDEGLSHREIAQRLGISRASVTRDLNASGLRYYVPGVEERRAEVVRLSRQGVTQPEIAKRLECSGSTVTRDLLIAGAPGPPHVPSVGQHPTVVCPACGHEEYKERATLAERGLLVAAKAVRLASVPGANPVDAVIQAANMEHYTDPNLVRNRARWLLQR